ncbi:O-antigen ligase family protein [Fibrobacter succinogenes]|uniref:O-antigen ligase-related domain-containing protein n=1 Tax=Fibrobacter succinogenes TaxID=833 RepID=A0A380S6Y3_FIBSU|nr:O-antigen ligase family protein [Fibrobacter succinogenes]PWJ34846.1 hypothetical protein IE02_2383 [Fibrobacter succinogenes subsp. elongatus]SUQ24969.1 hypothetical protein SAMN05661053_2383 [Fibrobacter succinogenes]
MLSWLINIVILALGLSIIKDLKRGFCLALCARILIPEVARFQGFGINLAIYDVLILCMWVSFLWNLYKGRISLFDRKLPTGLFFFLIFYNLSSAILILLSADIIPQEEQFKYLLKSAFQESSYLIVGYFALRDADKKFFFDLFFIIAIAAGLYGIYAYMTSSNPYVMSIITTYSENIGYDEFFTEARGALKGRTFGTLTHPLAWGQLWGILLAFYAVISQQEQKPFWFNISFIALAMINILLCGSRSALIATGVFFLFFFISRNRSTRLKIVIAFFIFFVGLLSVPVSKFDNPYITYFKSAVFFWDDSYSRSVGINGSNADMRLEQLDEVVTIIAMFPIGGLGYNSTSLLEDHPLFERMRGFESVAFRKTLEQGWLGFLCFIISLTVYALWVIKIMPTKKERIFMAGYFSSYFASILVTGIQHTWIVFLLLPLLYSSNENQDAENLKDETGELNDQE